MNLELHARNDQLVDIYLDLFARAMKNYLPSGLFKFIISKLDQGKTKMAGTRCMYERIQSKLKQTT